MSRLSSRSHAVLMLQVFALALMVIPSDTVVGAIGAGGYPAALVGMFMFALLLAASLFGLHDPLRHRHPIRTVLCLLWLAVLASYVLMDRPVDRGRGSSADRLLMQLAVITGVALVAAELPQLAQRRTPGAEGAVLGRRVLRGRRRDAVLDQPRRCAVPARPAGVLTQLREPGHPRPGGLNRVSGTAVYPIELGVVAGMLLPLAIYLANLRHRPKCAAAVGASGTDRARNPDIGVALGGPLGRLGARSAGGVDAGSPSAGRDLRRAVRPARGVHVGPRLDRHPWIILRGRSQRPVGANRVSDYPLVEGHFQEAPWFGRGGWTYIPDNAPGRPRQPVPEDRGRARHGRGHRAGRLLPRADDRSSASRGGVAVTLSLGSCAPHWPAPHWPRRGAR